MSVQLIVYPQNTDGTYNVLSGSPTEFLVNGISFNDLNLTATYQSNGNYPPYQDILNNAPASIPNTWYRFRVDGLVAYPIEAFGNLILDSIAGPNTLTGVYQKITNLTIGAQYTLTINLSVASTGVIVTQIADGNNIYDAGVHDPTLLQSTSVFTADAADTTILIAFFNNGVATLNISSISIQPVVGAVPSGANNILDNGQVILDLYEDEDLPLTLSVDNFKNVAEKVQSYSKAFNLPATKRNNNIFDRMFEITRSADGIIFNPYKKTQCILKQDGFILFEGFLRMLDVTDKEGEISYNVNLYSEVVAFADTLQDRTFRDLDFDELLHTYDYTEIRNSWQGLLNYANTGTSGFRNGGTVRYPFVDWNHQYTVDADGNPELPNLESAFRPFINIKYLIDIIFAATPFTYESAFFDTTDFNKLFMDFNWGGNSNPTPEDTYLGYWEKNASVSSNVGNGTFKALRLIPETVSGGIADSVVPPNYDTATYTITATTDNENYNVNYKFFVENTDSSSETVQFRWLHITAVGVVTQIDYFDTIIPPNYFSWAYGGSFDISLQTGDTLVPQFKASSNIQQRETFRSICTFVQSNNNTSSATLNTLRGDLGQWDFLKGLITMFNLVTLPDEDNPNNIKIEPYTDVFIPTGLAGTTLADRGIQHDWTEKIDISEIKLTPLTDLNRKTILKFVEDDDDYAFNQYKNLVGGHLYGSKKYNAGNEFNILQGTDEIIAEPFASTVVKPLMSQYFDFIIPSLYSYDSNDDTTEGFDNSPRIMFNNGVKTAALGTFTSCTYFVPPQNNATGDGAEDEFLQFSHLSTIPSSASSVDFHFGECQLMSGVGSPTPNNLFNTYWLPYYSELYNPNTRIMSIKVNLSAADINRFKFNDTVFIKNRVFRVNKINYKPNDLATVEFILIP